MPDKPTVRLTMTVEQAEKVSFGLSDILCWLSGFQAARAGTDISGHEPLSVETLKTLNIQLKTAIDDAEDNR